MSSLPIIFSKYAARILIVVLFIAGFICFNSQAENQPEKKTESNRQTPKLEDNIEKIPLAVRIYFRPLPDKMPGSENDTPEMIALGKRLFFEREISITKSQSCNDCHFLDDGRSGSDNRQTSLGAKGISGTRNAPTVFNAGFQTKQFWDGRASNLAEQAKGPLLNPIEMGMRTEKDVIDCLKASEVFNECFKLAFPGEQDPITFDNIALSMAAFERTLIAPARFDKYLKGQMNAITDDEKAGIKRFMSVGCDDCHSSTPVGGRLMKKLGVYHDYENQTDTGRFTVTALDEDMFVFKACMLRNVTLTPPYFHDGAIATLDEAIEKMAWLQLDVELSPAEIEEIKAFLYTLEGENLTGIKLNE